MSERRSQNNRVKRMCSSVEKGNNCNFNRFFPLGSFNKHPKNDKKEQWLEFTSRIYSRFTYICQHSIKMIEWCHFGTFHFNYLCAVIVRMISFFCCSFTPLVTFERWKTYEFFTYVLYVAMYADPLSAYVNLWLGTWSNHCVITPTLYDRWDYFTLGRVSAHIIGAKQMRTSWNVWWSAIAHSDSVLCGTLSTHLSIKKKECGFSEMDPIDYLEVYTFILNYHIWKNRCV